MEISSLKPPGYDFINIERTYRTEGGIGIFHKSEFQVDGHIHVLVFLGLSRKSFDVVQYHVFLVK